MEWILLVEQFYPEMRLRFGKFALPSCCGFIVVLFDLAMHHNFAIKDS